MNDRLLLAKCISLLYRESQIKEDPDKSADIVRTAVNNIKISEIGIGVTSDREILQALKTTALAMCTNPPDHDYDLNIVLQRIKIDTANDDKLYKAIAQGIEPELTEKALKKTVLNLRKSITNHFRESQIVELVGKASHKLRFERDSIPDINVFLSDLLSQLEPLQMVSDAVDPAVVSDVDIGNDQSLRHVFENISSANKGTGIYRTGWNAFNRMTQGGMRPGECVVINALQHKYKTGSTLSLFSQLATFNKPLTTDTTKKPLMLRISFEDDITSNLQFVYQYLKYCETREYVDLEAVTVDEMTQYVKNKLGATGFHIKMMRIDPTQWTYKHLVNTILQLEAQGYSVEILMLDYLSKLPTTGCNTTGPTGADKRDLLRRVRNFCGAKKILFITPHQLSMDAKMLIRGGIPEDQFVKELVGKGYFDGCKSLDQEYDLGIFIHLFKHNKETYLAWQRDKHRLPSIISNEEDLFFMYKFPKRSPIPEDREGEDQSFKKLNQAPSNASNDLFVL